jgi:hypothetical protein
MLLKIAVSVFPWVTVRWHGLTCPWSLVTAVYQPATKKRGGFKHLIYSIVFLESGEKEEKRQVNLQNTNQCYNEVSLGNQPWCENSVNIHFGDCLYLTHCLQKSDILIPFLHGWYHTDFLAFSHNKSFKSYKPMFIIFWAMGLCKCGRWSLHTEDGDSKDLQNAGHTYRVPSPKREETKASNCHESL